MKRIALLLIVCALSRAQTTFAIEDVNLFDGTSFHPHVTVTVEAGKIASFGPAGSVKVPDGTARIDGRGRTLMPGLIDSHVHLSAVWPEDALRQNLAFGVTTVIDMWTSQPPPVSPTPIKSIKELEAADSPKIASVLAAGTGASAPGGHPSHMAGPVLAARMPTLTSAEQADAFVAARVAEGSDFLKIIYDDAEAFGPKLPMLNRATVAALVEAAHRRGKLAIAHITSEQQARDVISAGVDGLAHLFVGETASPDFGNFAAEHHVFVIPTLSIQYSSCGMSDGASVLKDQAFAKAINAHFRDGLLQPLSGTKPCAKVRSKRFVSYTTQACRFSQAPTLREPGQPTARASIGNWNTSSTWGSRPPEPWPPQRRSPLPSSA